ncbi:MAG: hypothetical protein HY717_11375 [Planctomycetes bacterium]|nr:hypothetical protein [Planctomycetota bacterium]
MIKTIPKIPKILSPWKAVLALAMALAALAIFLPGRESRPALLVVLAPAGGGDGFPSEDGGGAAMVRLELEQPETRPEVLIQGFAALGPPRSSYDGRRAVFSGRRSAGGPMEIWEMSAAGSSLRPLISGGDRFDPCYLPDGRIVYSRSDPKSGSPARRTLHACLPDGAAESPITFGSARDRSPAVLPDGRILFRRHALAGQDPGRLLVVNPDGTGLLLFCEPAGGASIAAGPWTAGDAVLFAEEAAGAEWQGGGELMPPGRRLVSVSAREPLGARRIIAAGELVLESSEAWFSSAGGLPPGGWLAKAESILSSTAIPGYEEPLRPTGFAVAAPRTRPLKLTSVVDPSKSTGTLLCLDVHASRLAALAEEKRGRIRTARVLSAGGLLLGEAPVEPDGSFFIEVPADQPLHLELHGPDGLLARDESGLWVRPNENRCCIGCHEGPELSPENRVPLALERSAAPAVARSKESGIPRSKGGS